MPAEQCGKMAGSASSESKQSQPFDKTKFSFQQHYKAEVAAGVEVHREECCLLQILLGLHTVLNSPPEVKYPLLLFSVWILKSIIDIVPPRNPMYL